VINQEDRARRQAETGSCEPSREGVSALPGFDPARGIIAQKRPYMVFDYPRVYGETLDESQTCFMVSTLSIPQHPVALCGPDKAFADELCALMNGSAADEIKRLRAGIAAVADLINESDGVYGLHCNGDWSPWPELRTGGRFEDWLLDFDTALASGIEGEAGDAEERLHPEGESPAQSEASGDAPTSDGQEP
jgi:hypothetical protein